jgi:hypothetical protein
MNIFNTTIGGVVFATGLLVLKWCFDAEDIRLSYSHEDWSLDGKGELKHWFSPGPTDLFEMAPALITKETLNRTHDGIAGAIIKITRFCVYSESC